MKFFGKSRIRKILDQQGKSPFQESVSHALDGIGYTISHERNFKIELSFAFLVTISGALLKVSLLEWLVLILTISLVLVLEMLNTAIERCVDLVTKDYEELAKIAKDVAAGAVLIASLFSIVIGIIIFLPKLGLLIGG